MLRQGFYDAILSKASSRPDVDLRRLAKAWLDVTGADWVWIWLYNPFVKETPWEIREVESKNGDREAYIPNHGPVAANNSVAAYCCVTGLPELVTDIYTWSKTAPDGTKFGVCCKDTLASMSCVSFLSVPFSAPPNDADELQNAITGTVCCHFRGETKELEHPVASLKLMSKLTSLTIKNSYLAMQQMILLRLNALAHQFLADPTSPPLEDRKKYLSHVVDILTEYLQVKGASIFYQEDLLYPEVRCVATTGISQSPPTAIDPSRWEFVVYKPEEGLTGNVFKTGEPTVLSKQEAAEHRPRYVEIMDGKVLGRKEAVLLPIPKLERFANQEPRARGVIRCADLKNQLNDHTSRSFDPVDMNTLAFIAQQIAPILETLTVRIHRELAISLVKHDLLAPLGMIRDSAKSMAEDVDERTQIVKCRFYDVMNLGVAALVASNLVKQLDTDPGAIRQFAPERTLLVRTIIARIKNMLSHYARLENGMEIRFEGFEKIPPIWIDRNLIERVFVNLLVNAIKYGERGTRIEVLASVDESTQSFRIDVSNLGTGIQSEEKELVFERGYRSTAVISEKLGLGFGLYIARQAVEKHGGKLELTSLKNPTTFTVFLPITLKRGAP